MIIYVPCWSDYSRTMHVQDVLTGFYAAFFLAFSGTNPHPPPPRNLLFWQRRNRLQVLPGHEDRGTHLQLKGLAKRENHWGDLLDHQASKTRVHRLKLNAYIVLHIAHIHTCICIYIDLCVCVSTLVCMYLYMYIYIYIYIYTYIYMYIYIYIYIYIYWENVFGRPNAFSD